jgi:putative methionine-R-sulfoxide reductase with GAF domain
VHFHSPVRRESPIDLQPEQHAFLLSEVVDVNAALRNISTQARVLTDATGVAIALAHKNSMICRASVGHAPSLGSRLDTASGFSGECVRTGKALRCDDSESDPRVDLASCRRLGIRSIVAIPIRAGNQTVGLMEAFSPKPSAFSDWHVSVLRRLVNSPLLNIPALTPREFLLESEPANRVLSDKALEVPVPREAVAVRSTSTPAQFWSDVFVPDTLPWKRFAQSVGLHVVMIAGLAGLIRLAAHGPHAVQPKFDSADVLYYSSSEYFGKRQKLSAARRKIHLQLPDQQVMAVPREQSRKAEKFVVAPDIKLKRDMRAYPTLAWSAVSPSIPASAVVRKQFITPAAPVSVVAPAPDVSGAGSRRTIARPKLAVIEPPPSIQTGSRPAADISIGALQVISPPPEISYDGPNSKAGALRASWHDDVATVIAPPQSLDGIHLPSARGRGRASVGAAQVVPPPPQLSGSGNSRRPATTVQDDLASVVGPSPSIEGVGGTGTQAQRRTAFTTGETPIVPPPPQVAGTGNSRD